MARKRYICGCCGAELDIKRLKRAEIANGWMECLAPEGRVWMTPAAKKELPDGRTLYMDDEENLYLKEEFIELYAVDPERAFQFINSHLFRRNLRSLSDTANQTSISHKANRR